MGTYRGDLIRDELKKPLFEALDIADKGGYHDFVMGDPLDVAADVMDNDRTVEEICEAYTFDTGEVAELVEKWQEERGKT